jgi:hypothetical protein
VCSLRIDAWPAADASASIMRTVIIPRKRGMKINGHNISKYMNSVSQFLFPPLSMNYYY